MATSVAVTLPSLRARAEAAFGVARLREFVTTTLSDASLQTLLDAAFEAIEDAIGPPGEAEELLSARGDLLMLNRRAASITAVVERNPFTPVPLTADDYELSRSGRLLTRLQTGTNPSWCWRGRVKATYVPIDDTAARIVAATELVKLAITFSPGLASQSIGTWSETYVTSGKSYPEQRQDVLAGLADGGGIW